jgi:hypothetical protein
MTRKQTLIALAIAASAWTLNAQAGAADLKVYGMAVPSAAGARVVDITPDTRYVRVINGETITFNIGGQRYTWVFRLYQQEGALDLSAILPKELHADGVTVYVTPDPTYR